MVPVLRFLCRGTNDLFLYFLLSSYDTLRPASYLALLHLHLSKSQTPSLIVRAAPRRAVPLQVITLPQSPFVLQGMTIDKTRTSDATGSLRTRVLFAWQA